MLGIAGFAEDSLEGKHLAAVADMRQGSTGPSSRDTAGDNSEGCSKGKPVAAHSLD